MRKREREDWREYNRVLRKRLAARITPEPEFVVNEADVTYDPGPIIKTASEIAAMPWQEREMDMQTSGWTQVGTNRWRKGPPRQKVENQSPAFHTVDCYQSGRSRWQTYDKSDIGEPEVVFDAADTHRGPAVAKGLGIPYVKLPDGRSGPAAFGNSRKMQAYLKGTGQRILDKGERMNENAHEDAKSDFRRRFGKPWTPSQIEVLSDEEVAERFENVE